MRTVLILCAGAIFVIKPKISFGQLSGSNTFEFQYGNLPYEENRDLTTSYDQLNLYYDHSNFNLYGKVEHFLSPFRDRNFFSLTQKRAQYQDDHFNIRLGNFYETIGRGLLLRSYEIPGSVFEEAFYRTRYAFFQDVDGISVEYDHDYFDLQIVRGRPLFNPLPPNFEPDSLRRTDLVEAVESNLFLTKDISIGGTYMRVYENGQPDFKEYGSLTFNGNLPLNFQLTSEYAFDEDTQFLAFNGEDSYAFYTGLNYYYDTFGASFEYKNYNNFTLGSGFNNPPSLIKEHTYPVLNRSTHVLSTDNETGVQFEAFYTFEDGHTLTANYTAAKNEVSKEFNYEEYFIEVSYNVSDYLTIKSFLDYANDEPKGEENRISAGLITEQLFDYTWSVTLDLQYQQFERDFNAGRSKNYYTSLSVNYIPDLTLSTVFEASMDPNLTDNPTTREIETDIRMWFSGNILYEINPTHTLEVFVGKRRGGPACTSGICYERLDFEGVEIRLSSRF